MINACHGTGSFLARQQAIFSSTGIIGFDEPGVQRDAQQYARFEALRERKCVHLRPSARGVEKAAGVSALQPAEADVSPTSDVSSDGGVR
jgi:hypothetical protein